jgi:hypothetical protein
MGDLISSVSFLGISGAGEAEELALGEGLDSML